MPDPRFVMDGDEQLPCQVAARRQHEQLAHMLMPSTPLASILENVEGVLLGPPSLANIAAAALRENLRAELTSVQQQVATVALEGEPHGLECEDPDAGDTIFAMDEHIEQQPHHDCLMSAGGALLSELEHNCEVTAAAFARCSSASSSHNSSSHAHLLSFSVTSSCSSADSTVMCGVCFEQVPAISFAPCKHQLCVDCCKQLLDLNSRCVLTCPFCRCNVAHIASAATVEA